MVSSKQFSCFNFTSIARSTIDYCAEFFSTLLGFFKPKTIYKFDIEPDTHDWTPIERQKLLQYSMYDRHPLKPLEKIPYKFSYRFICNDRHCGGHKLMCVDWELGESYRQWKQKYSKDWEQAIVNRYETDMILKSDTHFFVGTVHGHPSAWIIVGLFYPPPQA